MVGGAITDADAAAADLPGPLGCSSTEMAPTWLAELVPRSIP